MKNNTLTKVDIRPQHHDRGKTSYIVAVATFDGNGLPREYQLMDEKSDLVWVQAAFQTLSLQMLLRECWGLSGFSRAMVRGPEIRIAIVKQKSGFKAIIFRSS